MEDLAPPLLSAVQDVRWQLSSGHSMREALRLYLDRTSTVFSHQIRAWWTLKSQGQAPPPDQFKGNSYYRAFLDLIERGLAGQPTLDHLRALELEIERAAQAELELHLATLPFKVLVPLLIFQFPAFLILLLGPLLRELTHQLGQ